MGAAISALIAKVVGLATWFGQLAIAVFSAGWLILTDLFCWGFEGILTVLQFVLDSLPGQQAFQGLNPGQYFASMPPEVVNMLGMIRLGEGLAIILAAIGIKLVLQVIPFTRLGS
ncbi:MULTISPECIES: DUF2523 family protein [Ralstonia solanacearum species complex]|uniref:DUF2523 domain-containing protein n=3 Tax=Ralstonia solanacearum TaxID=305 RepID=A0A7U7JE77_RALSL|nr:DUF2523 family protein [Ralstonia solanacearum]ALF90433.1 hypothetical protein RSUY_41290 [Ralstonia solanacearum]ATI29889.1 hypothetical protein CCY86_20700 [Ralstonia solanacearum]ATJ88631.1 hypothetical protein CDC59_20575 [Ralstonia solanacearum]EAP71785.1 Hypothetical Protein RRSL_01384 [Ralstonia solanacearum UW551]KEI31882.1 hypothetical protein CQ06_20145 [Ralstonia solanacearum]